MLLSLSAKGQSRRRTAFAQPHPVAWSVTGSVAADQALNGKEAEQHSISLRGDAGSLSSDSDDDDDDEDVG